MFFKRCDFVRIRFTERGCLWIVIDESSLFIVIQCRGRPRKPSRRYFLLASTLCLPSRRVVKMILQGIISFKRFFFVFFFFFCLPTSFVGISKPNEFQLDVVTEPFWVFLLLRLRYLLTIRDESVSVNNVPAVVSRKTVPTSP